MLVLSKNNFLLSYILALAQCVRLTEEHFESWIKKETYPWGANICIEVYVEHNKARNPQWLPLCLRSYEVNGEKWNPVLQIQPCRADTSSDMNVPFYNLFACIIKINNIYIINVVDKTIFYNFFAMAITSLYLIISFI